MSFVKSLCNGWIFLLSFRSVNGASYLFIPANDDFFSNCPENPDGFDSLFDSSNHTIEIIDDETIHLGGDIKVIWDVEPTDRIEFLGNAYRFERGAWQPTMFSSSSNNMCEQLYEKGQLWYNLWSKHVINQENSKNCMNRKGTILRVEPYNLDLKFTGIKAFNLAGLYKVVLTFTAIEQTNTPRNEICMEVIGEVYRTK